jgi:hypothetical protein
LLQRKGIDPSIAASIQLPNQYRFLPQYKLHHPLVVVALYPANCVDRLIRPRYWRELRGWDEIPPP